MCSRQRECQVHAKTPMQEWNWCALGKDRRLAWLSTVNLRNSSVKGSTANSEWGQTSYALYNRQAPLTQNQLFLFYPRQTLGGHGNPLQYSCPENSMDGDWQATVHGVTKSWTDWTHLHAKTESLNSKTETLSFPLQVVIKYKYTPYKVLWIYLYFYHKEVKITFLQLIVLRLFAELKETRRTSQRYRCFFFFPQLLCAAHKILVPQPGMEPMPPALEAKSKSVDHQGSPQGWEDITEELGMKESKLKQRDDSMGVLAHCFPRVTLISLWW